MSDTKSPSPAADRSLVRRNTSTRVPVPVTDPSAPGLDRSPSTTTIWPSKRGSRLAAGASGAGDSAGGRSPTTSSFRASRTAHGRPAFTRAVSSSSSSSGGRSPLAFPSFDTPIPPSLLHSPYLESSTSPFKRASPVTSPETSTARLPTVAVSRQMRSPTLSPPVLLTPATTSSSLSAAATSYFDDQDAHAPAARPRPLTLHLPEAHWHGKPDALSRSPPSAHGFKHHLLPSPVFVEGEGGEHRLAFVED